MSTNSNQATIISGNGNGASKSNGNGNGGAQGKGNGQEPCGAVLVCGGGVAGIQASLDLSAAGFRVYLVEESPTIGGGMARLDKTFPTGDCATCIISPKLVECMRDYNIDVMTMSDVVQLEGEASRFKVEVRRRPRSVDADKCTGCGDCWQACPVRNTVQLTEPIQPSGPLSEAENTLLDGILARHAGVAGALMPVLHDINATFGYLPRLVLEHLSAHWNVQLAEILRVASFYDEFRFEPAGRHVVEICTGTSCYSRGSADLLERLEKEIGAGPGETDKAGRFTVRTVRCLGLCALSPAMKIDGRGFGRVDLDRLPALLEQFA
jgi:NADH:ubiquinone oxidoreductase subunit E/NAD-dependent dihydropyrimidine dehydrogenase PreA subunit